MTDGVTSGVTLAGLTDEQRTKLGMCAELRRGEAAWQRDRLIVIGAAYELVESGHLHLGEVLAALEMSQSTWYRRLAELRTRLQGRSGPAAGAAGDQAAASARGVGEPE